jgi:hypothetical protein
MKYTKKDNKKHNPETHKKRSNRKSKKHVKKRGGNTTLKHRGGSIISNFRKFGNRLRDPYKTTIEVGLNELNNIILSPSVDTSNMLSTWTNTFVNQGSSLSSKRDDYVGIGSDDKLYKLAKAIYYSVYAHLLEESFPREELDNFITKMKVKRDKHFKDFKKQVNIGESIKFDDYIKNVSITDIEEIRLNNNIFYNEITKKINFIYSLEYQVPNKEDLITITITDNVKKLIEYLQLVFDTEAGDQTYNKKLASYKFRVNAENIDKEEYIKDLEWYYEKYSWRNAWLNVGHAIPTADPYVHREVPDIKDTYTANTYVPEHQLSSDPYVHDKVPEIEDNTNVIENRVTRKKGVNIKNVKQGYSTEQLFRPFFTPNNQESNGEPGSSNNTGIIPGSQGGGKPLQHKGKKRTRSRKKTSHKRKTHKKRSNRKSKKHVKKRGGNTTMKRGGDFVGYMKRLRSGTTNDNKMSVEEGLEALKGTVMNLNKSTDSNVDPKLIESFNTEFKNSGSSLKSKNNKRDFDHDGLEQFKKILFYSVYEKLINKFNIDNSDISKKKEEHTEKLIAYLENPDETDKTDFIKYAKIDKCNDDDNICEINLFGDPRYVIEFDDKDIIMPLIDYLKSSNDDHT